MKPVWLGSAQSTVSDRLGLVLSGVRGESPAWWSLVEEVRRRAGPMKSRRRSVRGGRGTRAVALSVGPWIPGRPLEEPSKGSFVTSRAGICSF